MSTHTVLNLGAGVQSTALYLMAVEALIRVDVAVFADVGEEPEEVYRHLEWLKTLGGPRIVTVSAGKLGDDLRRGRNSTGGRFASIPAFTADALGRPAGILRRQCTKEYKIEPINRWIKGELLGVPKGRRVPPGVNVVQLYGISLDETARAQRIAANTPKGWRTPEFPLLTLAMTRADCLRWIAANAYPPPPRSACVFCPYKRDSEWLRLRTHDPEGWARALEIDAALRAPGVVLNRRLNQKLFLHRSCQPLAEVHLSDDDRGQLGFWRECEGMCGN